MLQTLCYKTKKKGMSSLDVSVKPKGSSDEDVSENGEHIVTVFDLATEIEQSLQNVMKEMESNDQEFKKQYEVIEKKLQQLGK